MVRLGKTHGTWHGQGLGDWRRRRSWRGGDGTCRQEAGGEDGELHGKREIKRPKKYKNNALGSPRRASVGEAVPGQYRKKGGAQGFPGGVADFIWHAQDARTAVLVTYFWCSVKLSPTKDPAMTVYGQRGDRRRSNVEAER